MSYVLRSLAFAVLLIAGTASAAWAQFGHPTGVVAAGGAFGENASFSVRATLGQPQVGRVDGDDWAVNQGVWSAARGVGATGLFVRAASVSGNGLVDFGPTGVDLRFSGTGGSGLVTVEKFNDGPVTTPGISEQNVSQYRFVVSVADNLSLGSNTEVQLDVGTLDGIEDADNVAIYVRPTEDTGSFSSLSTTFDAGEAELVAMTGPLRELVLASDTDPLPIELTRFESRMDGQAVVLRWQTASETDNAGFRVQRKRPTADEWSNVGFVDGAGTAAGSRSYRFVDEEVPYAADSLHYRLQQVDTDGTTALSEPVRIRRGTPGEVQLLAPFPNPARSQATVRFTLPRRLEVTLRLYDMLGRRVITLERGTVKPGRAQRTLDTSTLANGVYFLRLRTENHTATRRLTVLR